MSTATCTGTVELSCDSPVWKASLLKSFHKLFQVTDCGSTGCSERLDSNDVENVSTELVNICETVMNLSKSDQIMCVEEIGESVTKLAPFMAQVYYGELT